MSLMLTDFNENEWMESNNLQSKSLQKSYCIKSFKKGVHLS